MVTTGKRADRVDDYSNGIPDETGDSREVSAQDLKVDAAAVGGWDGVGD